MATNRALSQEDGNLNSAPLVSSRLKTYSDIDLLFVGPATRAKLLFDRENVARISRGEPALPATGVTADIYKKIDAAAVRQSVKTILLTSHFEKPFLPLFGANLNSLLFELNDSMLAPIASRQILENLAIYEPRATPLSVNVSGNELMDTNEISITVVFQIKSTREQQTITTKVARLR